MKRIAMYALLVLGSAAVIYAVAVLFLFPEKETKEETGEVQDIEHEEVDEANPAKPPVMV